MWTVFEHVEGPNDTTEHAPGRGGFKYVVVNADSEMAAELFEAKFGFEPHESWDAHVVESEDAARELCGEITVEGGAIGIEQTRARSMGELHGSLDVHVMQRSEMADVASGNDIELPEQAAERAKEKNPNA